MTQSSFTDSSLALNQLEVGREKANHLINIYKCTLMHIHMLLKIIMLPFFETRFVCIFFNSIEYVLVIIHK